MEENAIARITLNPGRVGWFDPITNIHLTIGSPEAYVTKNMNTKNIQKAIKANIIRVLWGSLSSTQTLKNPKPKEAAPASKTEKVIQEEIVQAETIQKEAVQAETVQEDNKDSAEKTATSSDKKSKKKK